jgi:hypothetical protein
MSSKEKKLKPLLIGEFLHTVFWDGSDKKVTLEADINNDLNKETITLGLATQFGIQIDVDLKDNTYRLSEVSEDLKEGFYAQLVIKDITREGIPDILLAIGDGLTELFLYIWQFDRISYLNTQRKKYFNPFNYLGCLEGQEMMRVFPNGRIDVPFGSQGLFETYIWNGFKLEKIENDEEMDDKILNLETQMSQLRSMKCFLTGSPFCNQNISLKDNWVFLAYDYSNKEIENIMSIVSSVLKEFGFESIIAKDVKVNYDFMCKICKLIQESKYFIADITGLNFNVGFELGIAVGIGRDSIIIADKSSKEASDLKRTEAIKYSLENTEDFRNNLNKMIKNIIEK